MCVCVMCVYVCGWGDVLWTVSETGHSIVTNGASRLGVGYDHRRGEEGVGRTKKTLTLLEQHARLRAIWKEHNAANHAAASSSSSSSSRPVFY
jgi:hypothetical protein